MSILSKIFIVLLVVLTIALAVAVPVVQRHYLAYVDAYDRIKLEAENRAKAYEGQQGLLAQKEAALNNTIEQLTRENMRLRDETVAGQQAKIQELTSQKEEAKREAALLTNEKSQLTSLLARAQTEATTLRNLVTEGNSKQAQLTVDYREATEKLTEAQARVEYLLKQVKMLKEQVAISERMEREGVSVRTVSGEPGVGGVAPPAVEVGALPIRGKVTVVSGELATINVGQVDGVKKGMKFAVYRGRSFLADLVITRVEESNSVGKLELIRQNVQKDDQVLNRLD